LFFLAFPVITIALCLRAPAWGWWFFSPPMSPLGAEIDNLFYLILWIVTIVFIGTQVALCYTIWRFSGAQGGKGLFMHGSHNLEVLWTITPASVLLFISLYQMDVWARYRVKKNFDKHAVLHPVAEVTARQFEWRIRYPAPSRVFKDQSEVDQWLTFRQPDDLYAVNDLHFPTGRPVMIHLRTEDVQHAFFLPDLRIKQDALPGLVIPIWFEATKSKSYELVCAELCGWGHYKMKGRAVAEQDQDFAAYLQQLHDKQFDDGVAAKSEADKTNGEDQ
jgi:cytochrome c oxidase subunit 2